VVAEEAAGNVLKFRDENTLVIVLYLQAALYALLAVLLLWGSLSNWDRYAVEPEDAVVLAIGSVIFSINFGVTYLSARLLSEPVQFRSSPGGASFAKRAPFANGLICVILVLSLITNIYLIMLSPVFLGLAFIHYRTRKRLTLL
jgi:hypothetical protein